jgi:parvulin-like peptidyl-prolyl isomerase
LAQLTQESWFGGIPFGGQQLRWLARTQQLSTVIRAHILEGALESVSLSEEEQHQAMQAFCKEKELQSPEEIESFRCRLLLSDLDFQWFVERPLRLRRLCERDFLPKAEAKFLDRKTSLDRVVYSLIRVAEPWLARELYLRIVAQEADFASLAAEFSQGPESKTRGVVGPVPMLQAHPTLAQRLRTSSPGLVLEPFQIEQWWLVVRVESYTPASLDETTRLTMAQELLEEWIQAEVNRQMLQLAPHLLSTELALETP